MSIEGITNQVSSNTVGINSSDSIHEAITPSGDQEGESKAVKYGADDLESAVGIISKYTDLKSLGVSISIEDSLTTKFVIKLIDRETKEVIRQIPNEDAISLSKKNYLNYLNRIRGAKHGG